MAAARVPNRTLCIKCNKLKSTVKCSGCDKDFCLDDMIAHRQELGEQLGHTEDQFNQFANEIERANAEPNNHPFMHQIDQWEQESIEKIHRLAKDIRQELSSRVTNYTAQLQPQLKQLSDSLIECRRENDLADTDIDYYNEQLTLLKNTYTTAPNLQLRYTATSFIDRIYLISEAPLLRSARLAANTKWRQSAVTVAGGNGRGGEMNQLNYPWGACVDVHSTVYIADHDNGRVMAWKQGETTGKVVASGNGPGSRANQLKGPADVIVDYRTDSLVISDGDNRRVVRWSRHNAVNVDMIVSNGSYYGLAMDDDGTLYTADYDRHLVKRYRMRETQGTIVAGGNGQGNRLDQLSCPTYVFVDRDLSVYVSDKDNHRVMKWMKDANEGVVVAGGRDKGDRLTQLSYPHGIVVDELDSLYVADCCNHRIIRSGW